MRFPLFSTFLCIAAPVLLAQVSRPAAPKSKPAIPSRKPAAKVPAPAPAAAASEKSETGVKAVLTVNGEKITAKEFDQFIEGLPEQYKAQARGPMKRQIAEQLASVKVLAAEAQKRGLDQDPSVKARIAFQRENLLAGAAFEDIRKNAKLDEAAVRKYYEEHKKDYEQAQARHILIKFKGSPVPAREGRKELSEEEALAKTQELRKRLVAGEDFATLAKAESDDVGSGANGGDLGTFKRGAMVPAFDQVVFSQAIGELSEPIKTQFGYHLIKVEKRESKAFEEVRPELENRMRPDIAREEVQRLASDANIVYDESYFGPVNTQAVPGGGQVTPPVPAPPKTVPPPAVPR